MAHATDPRDTDSPLAQDHAAFRAMVREVKTDLDRLQSDPRSEECALLLFGRVQAMSERLRSHFAREESDWSGRSPDLDSSTQRWVRHLTEQHRAMELQLDHICALLEGCVGTASEVPRACDEALRELLRDLATHELSEDRLFQRSIFEDLDGT